MWEQLNTSENKSRVIDYVNNKFYKITSRDTSHIPDVLSKLSDKELEIVRSIQFRDSVQNTVNQWFLNTYHVEPDNHVKQNLSYILCSSENLNLSGTCTYNVFIVVLFQMYMYAKKTGVNLFNVHQTRYGMFSMFESMFNAMSSMSGTHDINDIVLYKNMKLFETSIDIAYRNKTSIFRTTQKVKNMHFPRVMKNSAFIRGLNLIPFLTVVEFDYDNDFIIKNDNPDNEFICCIFRGINIGKSYNNLKAISDNSHIFRNGFKYETQTICFAGEKTTHGLHIFALNKCIEGLPTFSYINDHRTKEFYTLNHVLFNDPNDKYKYLFCKYIVYKKTDVHSRKITNFDVFATITDNDDTKSYFFFKNRLHLKSFEEFENVYKNNTEIIIRNAKTVLQNKYPALADDIKKEKKTKKRPREMDEDDYDNAVYEIITLNEYTENLRKKKKKV